MATRRVISNARRAMLLAGSIAVSLVLAELLARTVHEGAFPYLNIFQSDPRYGVRLLSGESTRVRSRTGRITEVHANSLGFRGPAWPAYRDGAHEARVLLLGDSQMFGYGVPYAESTAAELQRRLPGGAVLDAAMPSWGPAEYRLALEEFGPVYRPRHVVFVVNAANDWFETVPNVRRTTARDGWAARVGAKEGLAFPGRASLMGRSHLMFAIRRLAHYVGDAEPATTDSARLLRRDISRLRRAEQAQRSKAFEALTGVTEACRDLGCKVVAVALPLDVQVDAAEWKKYRAAPRDLSATEPLLEDFLAGARALGVTTVNLLPVLRGVEPGAFLDDDYHLSPRGHGAVAEAMAAAIQGSS